MAFVGVFCVGELVADSKRVAIHAIQCSNVSILNNNSMIEVKVPHSKTDQLGRGTILSLQSTSGSLCPVRHLKSYLQFRPKVDGQLFIHASGKFLARYQFNAVLRKTLTALKVNAAHYSSHSFRIGAATKAAGLGMDETAIKELGRWESQAYKSYIRIPTSTLAK